MSMMRRARNRIALLLVLVGALPAWGQLVEEAKLVTDAVTDDIYVVQQGDVLLVPADKVIRSLGGTVEGEGGAFTLELDGRRVSFSETSRTAIAGVEMIELPSTPISIEKRPFVPIELFEAFLRPSQISISWTEKSKTLELGELVLSPLEVNFQVMRIGSITKVVITTAESDPYRLTRRPTSYVVRFSRPLQAVDITRRIDDPLVSRVLIGGRDVEIFLSTPKVAADSYELSSPSRVIIDLTASSVGDRPLIGEPVQPRVPTGRNEVGTIVIDPGHGGKEIGAQGPGGSFEKDLTLQIARRLGRLLEGRRWRVLLTRNGDQLVPHDDRTALANQSEADLFLSIHLNAVPVGTASGAETYFLSLNATDDRARLSAERENEGQGQTANAPGSDLDMILWDLAQQSYLKESSRFAERLQDALAEATGVSRRGVKQAPFRVLVGAMMPAALVEVGFISNPQEESRLRSAAYQQSVAESLAAAVERYRLESSAAPELERRAESATAGGLTPQ